MEWLLILSAAPQATIIVLLVIWVLKKLIPKPKRPKLTLIQGGKEEEGPYETRRN